MINCDWIIYFEFEVRAERLVFCPIRLVPKLQVAKRVLESLFFIGTLERYTRSVHHEVV